ncbi:MAG: Glucose-6-phosphate 1-dehydrogenase [Labilithrix sp.]|nr:Glucose-6-phosphate 1-dehydrogenase [Labilithrix sp.]
MPSSTTERSDALVFFGATGDLAFKQIWPALHELVRHGRLDMPIVATGRKPIGVEKIRARAKEAIEKSGKFDEATFAKLSSQLSYVAVDYDNPETFDEIKKEVGDARHVLGYVALPPEVFEKVAENLAKAGLAKGGRLALEKPFGESADSAKKLSGALHKHYPEESIFRIDHFLGKEQVENIVYFRAANPLVEGMLTREHVDSVQITMAEDFGIEGRAEFYDAVGAVRDVIQNHLLELVACLAMELPTERGHLALRASRARLLANVRTLGKDDIVRGQVEGYQDEKGVAAGSTTETFAVVRLMIDSPRWEGVPFYVRAGKALAVTATDAIVRWKRADHPVLEDKEQPAPNHLRFRVGPDSGIGFGANVKKNGEAMVGRSSEALLCHSTADAMKPYERLIGDAIEGDATLFASKEAAEQSWRVVDPVVGNVVPAHPYAKGSWGPREADALAPDGGWINPKATPER